MWQAHASWCFHLPLHAVSGASWQGLLQLTDWYCLTPQTLYRLQMGSYCHADCSAYDQPLQTSKLQHEEPLVFRLQACRHDAAVVFPVHHFSRGWSPSQLAGSQGYAQPLPCPEQKDNTWCNVCWDSTWCSVSYSVNTRAVLLQSNTQQTYLAHHGLRMLFLLVLLLLLLLLSLSLSLLLLLILWLLLT